MGCCGVSAAIGTGAGGARASRGEERAYGTGVERRGDSTDEAGIREQWSPEDGLVFVEGGRADGKSLSAVGRCAFDQLDWAVLSARTAAVCANDWVRQQPIEASPTGASWPAFIHAAGCSLHDENSAQPRAPSAPRH